MAFWEKLETLHQNTRYSHASLVSGCSFLTAVNKCSIDVQYIVLSTLYYALGLLAGKCDISHFLFDAAPFRVKRVPCSLNANQLVWKEWKWFELTSISNHVTIHSKGVPWGCWVNPVLTIPLSVTTFQNVFTGSSWHQSLRTFLCCEKTMIKNSKRIGWTTWDSTLLRSVTIDGQRRFGSWASCTIWRKKTLLKKCFQWYCLITRKEEWVVPFEMLFTK